MSIMMRVGPSSASLRPPRSPPSNSLTLVQSPGLDKKSCVYLFVIYKIAPLTNCWLWGASTQLKPVSHRKTRVAILPLSAGTDLVMPLPSSVAIRAGLLTRVGPPLSPEKGEVGFSSLKTHKSS